MIIKFLKPFSFLPAIILMYMIFSFSAQDGTTSAGLSYQVSYKIVEVGGEVLGADLQPWEVDRLANRFHVPVRKLAHMTEYFLLAIAMAFPLYVYGLRGILLLLTAGMICVAFACGDEYHQSYVDGRGPSKWDVLIDSVGVFFGIIFVRIIGWAGRKTVFRPFSRRRSRKADVSDPYVKDPRVNTPYMNDPRMQQPQANPRLSPGFDPNYYAQSSYGSDYSDPNYYVQSSYDSDYSDPNYYTQNSYGPNGYDPAAYRTRSGQDGSEPCYSDSRYGNLSYNDPYYEDDDVGTSDRLSEDMSLRKLVSDLKEQKQARRSAQGDDRPARRRKSNASIKRP